VEAVSALSLPQALEALSLGLAAGVLVDRLILRTAVDAWRRLARRRDAGG
jgi:hypothetical protein